MSLLCLRVDAILHLAPPTGPKGRTYDIYNYIYIYIDTGALISPEELALLAINVSINNEPLGHMYNTNCICRNKNRSLR